MRGSISILAGLVVVVAGVSKSEGQVTYSIIDLGSGTPYGINDSGQVVGQQSGGYAFLYSGGSIQTLGTLPGYVGSSFAFGINDNGQIVGYSVNWTGYAYHAFLYSGGSMQDLSTLGGIWSQATGINNSGQIVGMAYTGGYTQDNDERAFLHSGSGLLIDSDNLGTLPYGQLSYATAINNNGQAVGYSATNVDSQLHAFLFAGGGMVDLGTLPGGGNVSCATGINDSGQVVGYASAGGYVHAFLHSGGGSLVLSDNLGTLGGTSSEANGINDSGQVVGYAYASGNVEHAFVWQSDTLMQDLNSFISSTSGWTLTDATAINSNGQIVGWGSGPSGQTDAFLLTPNPTPEPSTLALLAAGAIGLAGYGIRRRRQNRSLSGVAKRMRGVNVNHAMRWFVRFGLLSLLWLVGIHAHAQSLTTLASFNGSNGQYSVAGLTASGNALYGTTEYGGAYGDGTVFSIPLGGGTPTALVSFNGSNGSNPDQGVMVIGNTLYGTTWGGGAYGSGAVFSVPLTGGNPTVLASFNGSNGLYPDAGVMVIGNTLYGTTNQGGAYGDGTVFSVPLNGGTPTVLASFNGSNGQSANGDLTLVGDTLCGVTWQGGAYNDGTVFSVPLTGGSPTVLASFNGSNGQYPYSGLMVIGNTLYGTAHRGGTYDYGTVFSIPVSGGSPTVLASFNGSNGNNPLGGVILVGNTLYGTTEYGGAYGDGTVFSVPVTGGSPTVLASFNGSNGQYPWATLTLSGNTLCGTTSNGGAYGGGTVFAVSGLAFAYAWNIASGGSWTMPGNWSPGGPPDDLGNTANFSQQTLAANATVTLDGSHIIGNLIFGDQGNAYNWTLAPGSGGTLTLQVPSGTPTITVNNQTTTISAVLAGNQGLLKAGSGKLVLTASNSYTGITVINAGTLTAGAAEMPGVGGPFGAQVATAVGTILFGGGTLQYSAANQFDYSGRFGAAGNQPIIIDTNGQTVTFAAPIQGASTSLMLNDSLGTGTAHHHRLQHLHRRHTDFCGHFASR